MEYTPDSRKAAAWGAMCWQGAEPVVRQGGDYRMKWNPVRGRDCLPVVLLALAALFMLSGSGAASAGPGADVKSLINEVLGILHHPGLRGPAHRSQKVDLVEKAAARRFNYREMARRSLGADWDGLTRGQQDEFVKNFSGLLKASFACRLDEFTKAAVAYQPEIVKFDYAEVPVVILRPNDKIPVTFRLLKEPQGWMIFDLVIEGVSLADNYRAQFSRIIESSSFQNLLKVLQAKMREECK
jgi:phospholipid transport system substrate-binding protein